MAIAMTTTANLLSSITSIGSHVVVLNSSLYTMLYTVTYKEGDTETGVTFVLGPGSKDYPTKWGPKPGSNLKIV